MRIYGFMVAKDEADIIAQAVQSLLDLGSFTKIFVYDNISTDDTASIVRAFDDKRIDVRSITQPFSDNLKYQLVREASDCISDGDWFVTLDADEIFQSPLLPLIQHAEQIGANCIEESCAQFYFTDKENNYKFEPNKPAIEQRRHYLVNYGEPRIFRFCHDFMITADLVKCRHPYFIVANESLLVHHFQFRSVFQTKKRLQNRILNDRYSKNWGHVRSASWKDYIVKARYLHKYDGFVKTGLPTGANLYRIENNPAYTIANLKWMRSKGHLTSDQLEFFKATRLQRIYRRFFTRFI